MTELTHEEILNGNLIVMPSGDIFWSATSDGQNLKLVVRGHSIKNNFDHLFASAQSLYVTCDKVKCYLDNLITMLEASGQSQAASSVIQLVGSVDMSMRIAREGIKEVLSHKID